MPFINSKVSVKVSKEKEVVIKQLLGNAIELIPGKSESYLMIGFEDEYVLYFAGKELEKGAFIEIKIFGGTTNEVYDKLTSEICNIYEQELKIPKNNIYIKYEEIEHWGWNGSNF